LAFRLSELLRPERILLGASPRGKQDVLIEIGSLAHRAMPEIGSQAVREALEEREGLASTAIGDGVAVPHGKVRGVPELTALLMTIPAGVEFDAPDGRPVEVVLALLAPPTAPDPLKALAKLSRVLRDGSFRRKLLAAPGPTEAYDLIKAHEASR
jgi:PTS system nitrogen regulatory IIA component